MKNTVKIYSVDFHTDDYIENLYYGTNEETALSIYEAINYRMIPKRYYNNKHMYVKISTCENMYEFIANKNIYDTKKISNKRILYG